MFETLIALTVFYQGTWFAYYIIAANSFLKDRKSALNLCAKKK